MLSRVKYSLITLFTVLLVSCSDSGNVGKDGYRFEDKEYEKTTVNIEFVIIENEKQFNEIKNQYAPNVQGLQAFGRLFPSENKCIIYIKDPSWEYVPEFIGHEVAHCIWGRWHQKRNASEEKKNLR
jgi:hypothetical protein